MSVLEYLDDKNPGRLRSCIGGIKLFLDSVYGLERINHGATSPEERDLYERKAAEYIADKTRDHKKDILNWKKNSKNSPGSMRVYLGVVKEFFEENGITFTKKENDVIKAKFKGGQEAPDDAPDHGTIRSLLEHSDVRMKAVVLLLSSTGMRIGELLSIREDQIDYSRRMITLKAEDTKTKTGRNVFFTREAELALNEFLKIRSKYIEDNNNHVAKMKHGIVTVDDGRIFPHDPNSINKTWNRALKRAGMYQKTGRGQQKFHPHSLRQFFSTQLRKDGAPDSVVEVLLGHKLYLGTYTRYTPAMLQEAYEKHSAALTIGGEDQVRKTIGALAEKATALNGTIDALQRDNTTLRERLQKIEDEQAHEKALRDQVEKDPSFQAIKRVAEEAAIRQYEKLNVRKS
jgi:integrase